ncbi:MAG TPA: DUF4367 domain-containing protein [Candidatus Saccharibacteria bacterium]|nr:DUF4367 domain-containing protein [Candidatus Saccharibacteria bacterium]
MKKDKIVTINGKRYDSISGMPLVRSTPQNVVKNNNINNIINSKSIHSLTHKSRTLYRHATQKPISHGPRISKTVGNSMDIAKSNNITRFAKNYPENKPKQTIESNRSELIRPVKHQLSKKINKYKSISITRPAIKQTVQKPAKVIKEEAISEAFKKIEKNRKHEKKHGILFKKINITIIIVFLLVLIFSLLYFNIPNFSIHIASTQSGIRATFPSYYPDGYRFKGPITYNDGSVTVNFGANTGDKKFKIEQQKSNWDSSAVKNMVEKESKGEFLTTLEQGLTIFTYGERAAWVNGGILYTISGDSQLSTDQIKKIAISL